MLPSSPLRRDHNVEKHACEPRPSARRLARIASVAPLGRAAMASAAPAGRSGGRRARAMRSVALLFLLLLAGDLAVVRVAATSAMYDDIREEVVADAVQRLDGVTQGLGVPDTPPPQPSLPPPGSAHTLPGLAASPPHLGGGRGCAALGTCGRKQEVADGGEPPAVSPAPDDRSYLHSTLPCDSITCAKTGKQYWKLHGSSASGPVSPLLQPDKPRSACRRARRPAAPALTLRADCPQTLSPEELEVTDAGVELIAQATPFYSECHQSDSACSAAPRGAARRQLTRLARARAQRECGKSLSSTSARVRATVACASRWRARRSRRRAGARWWIRGTSCRTSSSWP